MERDPGQLYVAYLQPTKFRQELLDLEDGPVAQTQGVVDVIVEALDKLCGRTQAFQVP